MDERGANIDLLFRNGLKDYEVLPPQEVWDKIQPVVKKNPHVILFRSAALVAVLIATGFLANRWSREIAPYPNNAIADLKIEHSLPVRPTTGLNFINKPENNLQPLPVTADNKNIEDISIPDRGTDHYQVTLNEMNILSENQSLKSSIVEGSIGSYKQQSNLDLVTDEPEFFPETKPVVSERWSIAAMASPTYYSRFSSGNTQMAKQLMASEQSMVSYSGGVALSYKINNRLSIQTGLYYSSNGQEVGDVNSFGGFRNYYTSKGSSNFELFTSSGSVKTSNADVFLQADGPGERIQTAYTSDVFDPEKANLQYIGNSIIQNFSYLQMPVVLRYKIIDRALDFNLAGGVSYDILVNNSVYAKSGSEKYPVGITEGLNQFTLSSSLGMGMEYSFSKKVSLNLEPTFRYYLNPFNEASGLKIHPYSFGIFSGFSYRF
jgi:hypothetical protein